jgi:hypothetical protein
MTSFREQAIKDVAAEVATPVETVKYILGEGFDQECEEDLLLRYAVSQREAWLRLEDALKILEKIVTELYPGDVEPDGEHLGEYTAVWNAVMNARAALNAVKEG